MPASTRLAIATARMTHAYRRQMREVARGAVIDAEAQTARAITEFAMRAAEMSLASGATAQRTTSLVQHITRAYQLPMYVDVTYTRILLSYQPSVASDPITLMRLVQAGGAEYDRLTRVETLVDRIQTQRLSIDEASARLQQIADEPRQYRQWVLWTAAAVMGGAVSAMLDGNLFDDLAAMVATLLVEIIRGALLGRGVNRFFSLAVSAAVPTLLSLLVMMLRASLPVELRMISPSLMVAAGMVNLLAGMGIVQAAGDAIDGFYISAAARATEVFVLTGGVVLGLLTTLWAGLYLGVPAYLSPSGNFVDSATVQLVTGGLVALTFGVSCNMGPRSLVAATLFGLVLWSGYLLAQGVLVAYPAQAGVGAVAVGVLARLLTKPLRIPVVALVTSGVAPLMPGLLLYRGVFALTTPGMSPEPGSTLLVRAFLTAIALSAGSSFGASIAGVVLRVVRSVRHRRDERIARSQPVPPAGTGLAGATAADPSTRPVDPVTEAVEPPATGPVEVPVAEATAHVSDELAAIPEEVTAS